VVHGLVMQAMIDPDDDYWLVDLFMPLWAV
jgi:hypothetical protein